jgi:hypothetical protein
MEEKSRTTEVRLKIDPCIQKLEAASKDEPAVILEGFVGLSGKTIRLYRSLGLSEYLEMPKECVLGTMPTTDKDGPTRLLVNGSCKVTAVSVIRCSITADSLQGSPRVSERSRPRIPEFPRHLLGVWHPGPEVDPWQCFEAQGRVSAFESALSIPSLEGEPREILENALGRALADVHRFCGY